MNQAPKRIDDVIPNPEDIAPGKRSPLQRAAIFAKRVRASVAYHPLGEVILFKDLKGKPVEYVDKECKLRVLRCTEVKGLKELRLAGHVNGTRNGKETGQPQVHWIRVEQVVGAYARRGTNHRQEVVFE